MPPKTIAEMLKSNKSSSILLNEKGGMKGTAIIALINNLSPQDKEIINNLGYLVIDLDDDLIKKIAELHDENIQLKALALIDNLTGLFNNRFFLKNLETEMARTKRTGHSCSLMIIDLDNFKLLNDTLGHVEGDKFLCEVGKVLRENVRATDMVCRYGGDEFAVIMPATELYPAIRIANRLNDAITKITTPEGVTISSSIGIAEYKVSSLSKIDEVIHAADSAMYDAKKNGKNKVFVSSEPVGVKVRPEAVTIEEKEALVKGLKKNKQGDNSVV
ncbi:MAG TPA: GGDEF domain-containing protein [Syntrophales bacterium]|nr:GGDEF domain-containing protein [Syntrophales bacterium]